MDRLTQLRGQAGGSRDSTLDTTSPPSEAYITANDGSKYFSLSEEDSTFDISPIKDVSLASAANPEKAVTDELISNLSPIPKKNDLLHGYKIGKQIDAANILSGEVDLFDNDNSYDGNELVIDDNVEMEEKSNPELKLSEAEGLSFQKNEDIGIEDSEPIGSKDTEVVLQIDGKNVNAIDIGNGLYLYRREGEEELAAVQIIDDDQQQPSFKFLKVRENAEGNLEVYEEIEVAKEVPIKEAKTTGKSASHVPIKEINKVINDPTSNITEKKNDLSQEVQCPNTPTKESSSDPKKNLENEPKAESNVNGDMTKFNETRKSPVIHSTPNKEGIPLTKTMVNQQLHPNRHSDNVKTIELHTDSKHKQTDVTVKCKESERKTLTLDDIQKEDSDLKMMDKMEQNIQKLSPDDIQKGDSDLKMPDKTEQNIQKISENVEKEDLQTSDSEQKELKTSESKNNDHKSTAQVDKMEESELSSPGKVFIDTTSNTNDAVKDENSTKSVAKQLDDNLSEKIEVSSLATSLCENITSQVMAALKDKTEMQEIVEKQLEFVGDSTPEKVKLSDVKLNDEVNKKDIKASNDENQPTEYKHEEKNTTLETCQPNDKPKTEEKVLTDLENDEKSSEPEKNIDVPLITINIEQETKVEIENILKNEQAPATKNENTSTSCHQILIKNSIPDTKSLPTNVDKALNDLSKESVDETSKDLEIVLKTPIDSKNTIEVSSVTPAKKSPDVKNKTEVSDAKVIIPPVIAKVQTTDNVFMQPAKVDRDIQDTNKIGKDCDKVSQDTKITKNQVKILNLSQDLKSQPTSSTTILKSGLESVKQRQNKQEDSNVRLPKGENVIIKKSQAITLSQNEAKPTSSEKLPIHAGVDQHESKAKVTTTLTSKNRPENIGKVSGVPTVDLDNNSKVEYKNKLPQKEITKQINIPLHVPKTTDTKTNIKKVETKTDNTDPKPMNNNNAAVPFGKWTEANRQEFLNKIKESKIPTNSSSSCSKQLKQPNDLNRRDVLQKIDSQRQTNSAMTKIQDSKSKLIVKPETKSFSNKAAVQESKTKPPIQETKPPTKTEQTAIRTARPVIIDKKIAKQEILPKTFTLKDMPNTVFSSSPTEKKEPTQRKEINNQDLIDKTIEGIINKALPPKQDEKKQEPITTATKNIKGITITSYQTKETKSSSLDDIEMKMNELHGIPFVERPLHELPHVFGNEVKVYAKSENSKAAVSKDSKIPNLLPFTNKKQSEKDDVVEIDSEEEIIEHEPITGDIVVNKNTMSPTQSKTGNCSSMSTQSNSCASNKAPIITENEFEKFARRNSITYENCLTVKYEANQPSNVVQTVVEKEVPVKKISRNELLLAEAKVKSTFKQQQQSLRPAPKHQNKIHITSKAVPLTDDSLNKNYHSKLQLAYQSALTAKRQKESPITIIEDKPVKVVFMDSNSEFMSKPLNIQGSQLSPKKRLLPEPEVNNDSVDSDILEVMNEGKSVDEIKFKAKHQRKQVLTPVETPDLELIEPKDLGLAEEVSPKKKRKTDDVKAEKSSKLLLPKKTYLLGRGAPAEDKQAISLDVNKIIMTDNVIQSTIVSHNTASAIDNLVKAAELLENQSETLNASASSTSNSTAQGTPVKRGRGRPRKYPLPEGSEQGKAKAPSPQKKPRLIDSKKPKITIDTTDDDDDDDDDVSTDDEIVRENWTMGKINEDIVCPICSKLFRSENVVYKHVKHCTGPSPSRSDSDKRSLRRSRQSRESERKSLDSNSDDMEPEKLKSKRESPKKRKSKASSDASVNKEEVIVIEDSPAVEKPKQAPRKPGRPRIHPLNAKIECEICGKSFRQMSYLVNHRLLHKKEGTNQTDNSNNGSNSVFSCEVCKKEFRKLHHLVQHRLIHNSSSAPAKPSRKSSAEQNENKSSKDKEIAKQSDDKSAAFRCEPCDKSFRKLHHLVEHRETHDGINRQKNPTVSTSTDKPVTDPPQCDVCKKTFRKLHHLIEHKEQHQETSSEKSDDKSVKSSLSARDIIHECSLCYMVFPNEHSLNKHSVFCQRKKRQSAAKQAKTEDESESTDSNAIPEKEENNSELEQTEVGQKIKESIIEPVIKNIEQTSEATVVEKVQKVINITEKRLSKESDVKHVESVKLCEPLTISEQKMSPKKRDFSETVIAKTDNESVIPAKLQKVEEKVKENKKIDETPKKKTVSKDKFSSTITKPRRSTNVPVSVVKDQRAAPESSDEDDVRYMLNPDFKDEKEIENTFMKVRADKRNSLQVERPNSKELVKRRTSLQHPPKVPRTKPKPIETRKPSSNAQKVTKIETAPATDSDDSDVKYSFPKTATEKAVKTEDTASVKPKVPKTPKDKKRAKMEKRKTLSGIAKRKSVGKILTTQVKDKPSPTKQIKRRPVEAGHRCDCGQLFGSAALLARHATLVHTPPRVRRERAPPEPVSKPPKSVDKTAPKKPQRKSTETTKTPPTRKSVKSAPEPTRTTAKTRNAAHRGVPVPDKMKKLLEKGKK